MARTTNPQPPQAAANGAVATEAHGRQAVVDMAGPAQVRIFSRHCQRFRFVRANRLGRWCRQRWLPSVALSGDPTIDETWSVESRQHELMEKLLARSDVREVLRSFETLGVKAITSAAGSIWTELALPRGTQLDEEEHVEPIRRGLRQLDAALDDLGSTHAFQHQGVSGRVWLLLALTLLGVGITLAEGARAFVDYAPTQFQWAGELMRRSLVVGIPLAVLSIPIAGRFMKGHIVSAYGVIHSMIAVMCLCLSAAWVGTTELNARLDPGPVTTIAGPVLELVPIDSAWAFGVTGVLMLPEGARKTRALFVTGSIATSLVPKESWLILDTSPGWLGVERRVSVRAQSGPRVK